MSDILVTIVSIGLIAVLMFVVPVMTMADRVDTVSQTDVQTLTSEFINEIKTTGVLTSDRYSRFVEELNSTGNLFDISMEFKILDENPGKKYLQETYDKIGENIYYSVYTTQITQQLQSTSENGGKWRLKEGDMVSITVRNTNLTIGQQVKDFFYKISGSDEYTIAASQAGLVIANGNV